MFSSKQIDFMKSLGLDFDFMHLSDNEYIAIEDAVGDAYTEAAQEHPNEATDVILLCESILDKMSEDEK